MTNTLLAYFEGLVRSAVFGPALWWFGLVLILYAMTLSYPRIKRERLTPTLDDGERQVDAIDVSWPFLHTQTFLTSRRVIQARFSWFLSKRKIKAVSLDDVHSIVWRRYTNWFLLLLAFYFLNTLNPVAFLLLLFGLQSKVYSVRFATPFAQMPYTRIVMTTTTRRQLAAARAFYEHALDIWSRMIVEKRLAAAVGAGMPATAPVREPTRVTAAPREDDFAWGPMLLFYVSSILVIALVQRLSGGHVSLDDYRFAPLYLALIVTLASVRLRDGVWLVLLGGVGLLTVKFPGAGLFSLVTDGGSPLFEEYVVLAGVLIGMAVAANLLRRVHPLLAPLAVIVWVAAPVVTRTGVALDWSLYAKLLAAIGWALIVPMGDRNVRTWFATHDHAV